MPWWVGELEDGCVGYGGVVGRGICMTCWRVVLSVVDWVVTWVIGARPDAAPDMYLKEPNLPRHS